MQYTVTTNTGVDVTARWTGRAIEVSAHPKGSLLIEWAGTQDRAISIFNKFVDKYTNKEQVKVKSFTTEELDAIYNGVSAMHTALTGFDDHGNPVDPGVTVAVEAPLSQEAVIRLELCTLQNAIKYAGTLKSFYAKREIDDAEKALTYNAAFKINTLLGIIDAQRKELEALKAITDSITKMTSKGGEWNGYNGDNLLAQLSIDVEGLGKS